MNLDLPDATINVEIDGPTDAPVILAWNGSMCTLRMWDKVVPIVTESFRFIRFNVRGAGDSSVAANPDIEYTFEQYAKDANFILDHFDADRCHIWAMAWGSRAALAYCSINGSRVISAALFDANTGPADAAAQREGSRKAVKLQEAAGIERVGRPEGWNLHTDPTNAQLAMSAAAKYDLPGAVSDLKMPVLVATGDHDPNLEPSRELVANLADGRLVVMENVGHGSVLQRPDLTARIFLEFQTSIGG